MNRDLDPEMLIAHNKRLENENRVLRQTLWDDYYKASAIGISTNIGNSSLVAERAAAMADAMVEEREKRYGIS